METNNQLLDQQLQNQDWEGVAQTLNNLSPPQIVDVLSDLSEEHQIALCHHFPSKRFADIFSHCESEQQMALSRALSREGISELLMNLRPDDRTRFLEHLPEETSQTYLHYLRDKEQTESSQLLAFPQESVGRLMTPQYIAVQENWSLEQAIHHIRQQGQDVESLNTIYVTSENGELVDALELERFVLGHPSDSVSQIMDHSFVALSPEMDREEAVRTIQKYDLYALPVVDAHNMLMGVVTADDVMDIAEEETTEDFQKGAAIDPLSTSYRHATVWSLYRKRIPWLFTLLFVNLAASSVIVFYEDILASVISLTFFIPLLMGAGGNTGAQSATLVVRALATEDLPESYWSKIFAKEVVVGGTLGLTLGVLIGGLGVIHENLSIGLVVALAMIAVVVVSNLLGIFFPFLLTKMKFDPAVASSPMVTSTADVTTLVLYFVIATFWLNV